ncbi:MAG: hypothetical protein KDL87_05210, partial [Verrucomicrobiae bacterium]|nr:hypothetical protein [Verrucomicrobiae bacterium]
WDGTLRVWDAQTGTCLTCLAVQKRESRSVIGVLALADGRILSWTRDDKTLRLWDAATGTCHAVLEGHTGGIEGALELPNGRVLSWAGDGTLRVWDAQTGTCVAVLEGHTNSVEGALKLPDGRILSWEWDKTLRVWNPLRVWDAETGACLQVIVKSDSPISNPELFHQLHQCVEQTYPSTQELRCVIFDWIADPSGRRGERTIRLVHRRYFKPLLKWQAESDSRALLLQPDGTLVVAQHNRQVCILKLHHGNRRVTLAEVEEILRSGGR